MRSVVTLIGVFATLLFYAGSAFGQDYGAPLDPIAPTEHAQCDDLYEQYQPILLKLRERAQAASGFMDEAFGHNDFATAERWFHRAMLLHDQEFQVMSDAGAARLRCNQQVWAYEAERRAAQRDQSQPTQRVQSQAAQDVQSNTAYAAEAVAKAAGWSALNAFATTKGAPPYLAGLLAIYGSVSDIQNTLRGLSGRGGAAGYVSAAFTSVSSVEGWNPLRSMLVDGALDRLLAINSSAQDKLIAGIADFDNTNTAPALLAAASSARNGLLTGAEPPATLPIADHYSDDMLEVMREHQGLYAARGAAYEKAVREVAEQYKKLTEPVQNSPASTTTTSRKYTPEQCNLLLQQVQAYRNVLAAYQAAGHGALIQLGIDANQREHDQWCR